MGNLSSKSDLSSYCLSTIPYRPDMIPKILASTNDRDRMHDVTDDLARDILTTEDTERNAQTRNNAN